MLSCVQGDAEASLHKELRGPWMLPPFPTGSVEGAARGRHSCSPVLPTQPPSVACDPSLWKGGCLLLCRRSTHGLASKSSLGATLRGSFRHDVPFPLATEEGWSRQQRLMGRCELNTYCSCHSHLRQFLDGSTPPGSFLAARGHF